MKNIVASLTTLELINKISSAANDLLYSSDYGFLNLTSKNAIDNRNKILEKYDYEVSKIQTKSSVSLSAQILSSKKKEFISKIEAHCNKELFVWIDEEYSKFLDNSYFELSIDKNNAEIIFYRLIQALNWYSNIKKLSKEEYNSCLLQIQTRFEKVLNSKDEDFITKNEAKKSNVDEFLSFWLMILENKDKFLEVDFSLDEIMLSNADVALFQSIKNQLATKSAQKILDEILLINSALEVLNLAKNDEKYELIMQLLYDLRFGDKDKQEVSEEEKISTIKRRLSLFKDKNKASKEYFKKLIIS